MDCDNCYEPIQVCVNTISFKVNVPDGEQFVSHSFEMVGWLKDSIMVLANGKS